jgi:hypothetical protein
MENLMHDFKFPAYTALLSVSLLLPAFAGPPAGPMVPAGVGVTHVFESDFEDIDNAVSVTEGSVSVDWMRFGRQGGMLRGGVEAGWTRFELDNDTTLVPGVALELTDMYRAELGLLRTGRAGEWTWLAGGNMEVGGEEDADFLDDPGFGFLLGARTPVSASVELGIGVVGGWGLEEDLRVFPVPFVTWQISEQLTLETRRGLGLEYRPHGPRGRMVSASMEYDSSRFRLSPDSAVPDGVVEYSRVPVTLQWEEPVGRSTRLACAVSFVPWQEFRVEDDDGHELEEESTESAAAVSIRLEHTF